MSDLATLKTRLAEAETAHHKLMLGHSAVSVSEAGSAVTYTAANANQLANYIATLKSQITRLEGGSGQRRPIYV